ncbi:hypothetical protein [Mammaliicoccus sciuri]|uniref:hypothetical protein n=1 Tax=Mammaliicoccus sciuri TaxID=1296 RepID=UPI001F1727D5|nr:hypothetical protein [Mammaliicoccus sciuri]MCE5086327.1 hypothetical protein [Mammaliicoccus sciuri]
MKKVISLLVIIGLAVILTACNNYPYKLDKEKTEKSVRDTAIDRIPISLQKEEYKKSDIVIKEIGLAEAESYAKDDEKDYKYFIKYGSKDGKLNREMVMTEQYESAIENLYKAKEGSLEKVDDSQ